MDRLTLHDASLEPCQRHEGQAPGATVAPDPLETALRKNIVALRYLPADTMARHAVVARILNWEDPLVEYDPGDHEVKLIATNPGKLIGRLQRQLDVLLAFRPQAAVEPEGEQTTGKDGDGQTAPDSPSTEGN